MDDMRKYKVETISLLEKSKKLLRDVYDYTYVYVPYWLYVNFTFTVRLS